MCLSLCVLVPLIQEQAVPLRREQASSSDSAATTSRSLRSASAPGECDAGETGYDVGTIEFHGTHVGGRTDQWEHGSPGPVPT